MAKTRGWQDYIPTSGEGRALVEVKGRVGGKGRTMRKSSGGKWNRLRGRSFTAKKPKYFIPTSPGVYPSSVAPYTGKQPHLYYDLNGSLQSGGGTGVQKGWLFALTPKTLLRDGVDSFPGMIGDTETEYDRLRIVGMDGQLRWSPISPISDPAQPGVYDPGELAGTLTWAWYKFRASQSDLAGGFSRSWPWLAFTDADAAGNADTLVPALGAPTSEAVKDVDWRYRAKLIGKGSLVWKLDPRVYFNTVEEAPQQMWVPTHYNVRLPRKLVCDVGGDEALGMVYYIRNFGSVNGVGGAPASRFSFESMRVKCIEID